jgi:hypothetical protein
MFVDPVNLVELPKQMGGKWHPVRSIVRLKRFDDLDGLIGLALRPSLEPRCVIGGLRIKIPRL